MTTEEEISVLLEFILLGMGIFSMLLIFFSFIEAGKTLFIFSSVFTMFYLIYRISKELKK